MIARLMCSLIAIVMLTVACGGDGSEDLAEKLAAANQEIKEITAAHDALSEANAALEGKIDRLHEENRESSFGPKYSSGPCGVFRLAGTELIKLRWIDDHRDDIDPREWVDVEGGVWWEKTGVDIGHELQGYDVKKRELNTASQRDPDHVQAVKVKEDRNHYFHFEWVAGGPDAYLGSKVGPVKDIISDMEGLLGASEYMYAGVLGVDDNCEWDIVLTAGNSGLETEIRKNPDGYRDHWFVSFRFKDYWECREEGELPTSSPIKYNAETDEFFTDCSEAE